ncbi:Non-LTR retroelement reverse transcriptase-like protein [Tieghemostelium lacteum]|uniref:Non-LTR retroelement reverse transcriptase-like protein n=1 Tax=Tieghemostelium lacteum TaxID=361077 RepID=A0A151Z6D4_TIELA|nr:Non-LTR retroelement reverse transcriptase-like protein [Tieghemostelium lacteum]|eukprot:KYQ89520.1 Non-LTR retroelement reverse transcriptase-like protein [Tieghemostelium lacteum]
MSGEVVIKRGTKQGDPLSSTIFAIVIEPLIQAILNDKEIKGILLKRLTTPIKIGAFADDIASINSSVDDLNKVLEWIKLYCKDTSSSLNADKTIMIATGKSTPTNLPFQLSDVPERYLGLNFTGKGLNSKIDQIIEEITVLLSNWKKEGYTLRSKMSILKTYALSKLTYQCYIDSMTKEQIEKVNNVSTWFLFSSMRNTFEPETKYKTLMTMDRAYADWEVGGIKMWDLELRQEAFKIWNMNRLLCIHFDRECNEVQQWYIQQVTTGRIVSSILRNQMEAWKDYRTNHAATMPKLNKLNEETEDVKWVNGFRNMSNRPIKLRDIYANLVIKKYTSIRLTDGQKNLRYNINITGILQKISKVIHHKGRNTLFRLPSWHQPSKNELSNRFMSSIDH